MVAIAAPFLQSLTLAVRPPDESSMIAGDRSIMTLALSRRFLTAAAALAAAFWCTAARADDAKETLPPGAKLIKIEAQPAQIALTNPFEYAQVVLTGVLDTGERLDVTRMAAVEAPAAVKLTPTVQVRPSADGDGALKFTLAGQMATIPVKVTGQKDKYQVSFIRDVMPTLSRVGCNAGTCHGSANGKDGFKLSLRGYDPVLDHRSLTDDLEGRRFNRAAPDTSLMLLKPSGEVPHIGGALIQPGTPYYEMLRAWIAQGVKLDLDSPRVAKIEVAPSAAVIPLPGMKQQFAVYATFTDGKVRDVTTEAFLESSNTEVASVSRQAVMTAVRRGESTVLARYEGAYAASQIVVMGDRTGYAWKDAPVYNYIDALVYDKLKAVKELPGEVCTDAEFVRRVHLDLIGLPPQPDVVRAFLADPRPQRVKRDELVDKLIGSPEYVEYWTNKWGDLLDVNRKFLGEQGAKTYRDWIRKAVADNMPYDQFAHAILTASGSNIDNPPASYYKILRDPDAAMENTTQLFLAVRFNCNKCHDHPFERWTQGQYYDLAAFFAQIDRKEDPRFAGQKLAGTDVDAGKPLAEIVSDTKDGDVKHPRTGAVAKPTFPFPVNDPAQPNATRREQLAHWITSKENPYFAKSYVNRLWSYLVGVGIIEPIDDIRAGNPPSNPALLDRLTQEFIGNGFNTREIMRTICKSRTYQLSIQTNPWNKGDDANYAHAVPRRLQAEVLYDAIMRAAGSVGSLPNGERANQLLDSSQDAPGGFLALFGKPPRESVCECERSGAMMLGPVMTMVNGPVVADAIKDPNNRIAKLLAAEKDDAKVVDELYMAVLCRPPTPAELAAGLKALKDGEADYPAAAAEHDKRAAELAAYEKGLDERQAQWEKDQKGATGWTVVDVEKAEANDGAKLTKQPDGSIMATGKNPTPVTYTLTAKVKLTGLTGIRLEVLPDPSLPAQGPGRAPNGNFVLNEFTVTAKPMGDTGPFQPVVLQNAQADFSQDQWAVAGAIDGNPESGWAVAPQFGKAHTAVFEIKDPLAAAQFPNGAALTITMLQQFPGKEHNIGKFRISATTSKGPIQLSGPPEPIAKILNTEPAQRTPEQKAELTRYFRSLDGQYPNVVKRAAEFPMPVDKRHPGAQDLVWALLNSKAFQFNH
jgi:hypothetical protein